MKLMKMSMTNIMSTIVSMTISPFSFKQLFFGFILREKRINPCHRGPVGKETNKLSTLISLNVAEQSEAKSAKRSFASKK